MKVDKKIKYKFFLAKKGLTLPEVMVVVAILSVLSLLFYSLVVGTMRTNMLLEAENMLTSYGQRTINILKTEVAQSRRIYENNTEDNQLLGRINLPSDYPAISSSRLPIADLTAKKPKDVPDANIGNSIFFLEDVVPYNFQNKYIIDLYQFNYYYINEQSAGAVQIGSKANYLDLIKFQSKPYASYQQLNQAQSNLSSEDWNDLTDALVANGIIYAVDLNAADITTTFYQISGNSLNGQSGHNIQEERAAPVIPLIRGGKATGNVRYSVAYNTAADFSIFQQVPKFSTDTSVPFGFEVVLIGSTAARQVTMRLVLAAGLQRQIRSLANDVTVHARYF